MVKLGQKTKDMIGALRKVYDANPTPPQKKSVIYKWITSFKEGQSLVEGNKQFDRPLTSVCEEKKMLFEI